VLEREAHGNLLALAAATSKARGRRSINRLDEDTVLAGPKKGPFAARRPVDFVLSDEQQMLKAATRDLLADQSASVDVRRSLDSEERPAKLWSLGSDLGWAGLAVPEVHGGSGQGLVELSLVAEELGRAGARTPFVPTVLAAAAIARGGSPTLQAEVLPALADGSVTGAWAVAEAGRPWSVDPPLSSATVDGDELVVSGCWTLVQDASEAGWLLVTTAMAGEPVLVLVEAGVTGLSVRRQEVLDLTRTFHEVRLDNVRLPAARRLQLEATQLQRLLDDAAVMTSADALGAGQHLLAMTVDYAKVRQQFGRAIGSFQAIKHKLATMRIGLQGAHAATYYAAMAADAGAPDAPRAAAVAKAYTSEAMSALAGEALQVHGGIGFTWEHDLHLYLRRIRVDAVLYGDVPLHQERLCALLEDDRRPAS
jgi:alkylation response protein AidB-like acyl-CoA dehydrogenase